MSLFKRGVMERVPETYTFAKGANETLGPDGYKIAVTALLGFTPTNWETDEVFKNRNGLNLEDLNAIIKQKLDYIIVEQYIPDIIANMDDECKGMITIKDVRKAWEKVNSQIPWSKIEESFREITDNGVIDYCLLFELIMNESERSARNTFKSY